LKQPTPNQKFLSEPEKPETTIIDYRRIFFRVVKYWYVIVVSLLLGLTIAYVKNRYATRIYTVNASIIIKETQETSEGKLLYNNPLVSFYRNYLNELYIIRSYPLIEQTLEELNFDVSFQREGNFLTTEVYDFLPIQVEVIDQGEIQRKNFHFEVVDESHFELSEYRRNGDDKINPKKFNFNDTITYDGLTLTMSSHNKAIISRYVNQPYIFSYSAPAMMTGSYVNRLRADWAEEGAGVINLSINGANPKKEIDFLNGLIVRYQEYDLSKKNAAATRTIDFINDQLNSISDSLKKAERQLELFKNKNVVTNLNEEALRLYKRIEELDLQKSELTIRNSYFNYLRKYIQENENALDQIVLPSSVGLQDEILTNLVSSMINLQMELKMVRDQQKLEQPLVTNKRRALDEIKGDLLESVKNLKSVDQIRLDFINKNIATIERQLDYLPAAEKQLVSIRRNYTLLENLYIFLLQKRAEAGISKASTASDIVVVNPPMQSGGSISPKITQNYIIAFILSILIPLVCFSLIEVFNNRVQSREDIEKITALPFIAGLGHKKSSDNQEVLKNPKSHIAESFRALRSNLNYFIGNKNKAVFMITSSISGEGKTFTTINLGSVLAMSGKRTLIVGADMRKPKIFDDFGFSNSVGLSSFLAGLSSFDETVQPISGTSMDFVSGGPIPPNPSELLLNEKMREFIETARNRYDYVVIDTPPMGIVADALTLITYADHTLFLVRQNYTPKVLLRTVEEYYQTGRLKNVSIILNDIYKSGPGYGYGYGYGYGHGYGYGYEKNGQGYYE
jgi:capsular exopolysaccharide synthesis family protein